MHPEINKICKQGLPLCRAATVSNLEPGAWRSTSGLLEVTAGRNPTLMPQVGLRRLYPEVSGSAARYEETLRRSLSEEAEIKETLKIKVLCLG